MEFQIDQLLTVTFTLFAVIDIVGSIPLLISLKEKMGGIRSIQVTLISGALMILFLFAGKPFLKIAVGYYQYTIPSAGLKTVSIPVNLFHADHTRWSGAQ